MDPEVTGAFIDPTVGDAPDMRCSGCDCDDDACGNHDSCGCDHYGYN